jgi:aminoglycoside 2''-phosphotransferase
VAGFESWFQAVPGEAEDTWPASPLERTVGFSRYRKAIENCFPQIQMCTCRPILEGWSSLVLEVNRELIFRFPRRPEIVPGLEKEMALLPVLAQALSVAVPRFEFIGRGGAEPDWPFVGYRKILGVALAREGLRPAQAGRLAQRVAQVLSELHRFPVPRAAQLKVPVTSAQEWRQEYRNLYAWGQEHAFPLLEPAGQARVTAVWDGFLGDEANFCFQPVLIHRDLAGEHILCDMGRGVVNGIIDWEDAAVGDPALDFVGLLCDMGRHFTEQVLEAYQGKVDSTFWQRMIFYSRICPLYEIQFGLATGDREHLQHGLKAMGAILDPAPAQDDGYRASDIDLDGQGPDQRTGHAWSCGL